MMSLSRPLAAAALLVCSFSAAAFPQQPPTQPDKVVTPTQPTAAQQAAADRGMTVSNDQIANAIKQSGLTEQQVRARLRAAGYDPGLADPFYAASGAAASQPGAAGTTGQSQDFVRALTALGILSPSTNSSNESTQARDTTTAPVRAGGVFGKDVFARASTAFDPVTSGPVDPSYRLGIGDELQLVLTGDVELAYALELRRDGTVIIPQVGQIPLAGLTMDAARALLQSKMSGAYSGLKTGADHLDLTISNLRTNAIFVIGEVESPGAMQVNALATVFSAIARAGGPTDRGSFRDIEVRRGGKVIEHLDLYDYLLNGNNAGDIRLEQGDVVYVPLNQRVVAVTGAVRRPRIFQLRDGEGFSDLLKFAGGLLPTASTQRVQIDRILPPAQRRPGFDRVKVDVDLNGNLDSLSRVKLYDGDIVSVFDIGQVRRNVVYVNGEVFQPGEYQYKPSMTLDSLLGQSQGMLPWALSKQVKIVRGIPLTGRSELFSVDATTPQGKAFPLEEFDSVEVLDSRLAYPGGQVTIDGAVNHPSTRRFLEHETLRDAVERSGGFREDAERVEVYRHLVHSTFNDTTSQRFDFVLRPGRNLDSTAAAFVLDRDDHVYVRSSPGYQPQKFVTVDGQFRYDGTYAITEDQDRVSDVVERAGGVLPGGYAQGFQLVRGGKPMAVNFANAMRGDALDDVPLRNGDTLRIQRDPGTVLVTGAVNRTSLIQYRPGLSLHDYIDLAGGAAENGDENRAVVDYPSGFSRRAKRVALFFRSTPGVVSGSTITIPEKPPARNTVSDIWGKVLASASALASLAIAYKAVTR